MKTGSIAGAYIIVQHSVLLINKHKHVWINTFSGS